MLEKNRTYTFLLFSFLLTGLMTSCVSPQKVVERGDYDQAIGLAINKLAGKQKKKGKYVMALEDAFAKATDKDMAKADRLKMDGRPEKWEEINDIYRRIRSRQERIAPLLPLYDENGIKASFRFVKIDGLERESREKAADYLYSQALSLIDNAQSGDRFAARKAYFNLEKINQYYRDYKDKSTLMNLAREIGTSHILVELENDAPVVLPAGFTRALMELQVYQFNSEWQQYHLEKDTKINFDYRVLLRITDVDVSPERITERQYEETKEIIDGVEYVLDQNGNVAKDTLGNDITVPRKVVIGAQILEVYQQKFATVAARLDVVDLHQGSIIDTHNLRAETRFEHYASTYRGDKRALSGDSKRRIGNAPRPFPRDDDMLLDAAEDLKQVLLSKMSRSGIVL
ncbi:MAG: hypothetical protein DHS20C18_09340 [Saprospiraceae bacterium]|nr:MAG: hypothetical protein DHS20C18_09340 [Saprospiraceae bacterium]